MMCFTRVDALSGGYGIDVVLHVAYRWTYVEVA